MTISNAYCKGLSLLELLIAVAVLGIIVSFAYPSYSAYKDKVDNGVAISQLQVLIDKIEIFNAVNNRFPNSLDELSLPGEQKTDPWGNNYVYLNHSTVKNNGKVRKDKNLKPINGAYDLYSKGKDGDSTSPINAKKSQDDIIVANDGSYIGLASDY